VYEYHDPCASQIFCPDPTTEPRFLQMLESTIQAKDSVGGCVECKVQGLPAGIGDPLFDKIPSLLSSAMMSIPASRGFEIGDGFAAASMLGSSHNDPFVVAGSSVQYASNHAGGVLGGITTGCPLLFRVAFKPSSVATSRDAEYSRNDPCVAIRAVPVVSAMTACVLVDALLSHRAVSRFVT
jgi:chorismate synthase